MVIDEFPYGKSSIVLVCLYVCNISTHYGRTDKHTHKEQFLNKIGNSSLSL